MSNPNVSILALTAAVGNGIAQAQTLGAAGPLTLNGSLVTDGVANLTSANAGGRRVVLASSANDSTVVFTITGTGPAGNMPVGPTIVETITGLNANSASTKNDFATVTSIVASAATVGTITAGTNTTASTPWIVDNIDITPFYIGVGVSVSGSVTYTVEHTYDDPNWQMMQGGTTTEMLSYRPPLAWSDSTLLNATTNGETVLGPGPVFAHRLTVTAGTGTATMQSIQAGIHN